jgi:integrase
MRLTNQTIADLHCPPDRSELIVFDDAMPGFGLRCRASGVRRWIVQYEMAGRTRRITLGSPEVFSLDEARRCARVELAKKALGRNPAQERAEERAAAKQTFGSVVEQYLADRQGKVRPSTWAEYQRYLRKWWAPLHRLPLHKIGRRDVAAHLSGPPVAAGQARSALSRFFTWAIKQGFDLNSNPVVGTAVPDEHIPSRDRVLSDAELVAIWRMSGDDTYGKIVRLLILCGSRRREIGDMQWSELDPERGLWTITAERSKNGRPFTLPLSAAAWSIIADVPHNGVFLFGRRSGFGAWAVNKQALDQRAGIASWRLHDLRRTAATGMAEIGIQPHIIEAVLNHVSGHKGGIAGVYNKARYEREMAAALERWADHVRSLVDGCERKIVPLHQ